MKAARGCLRGEVRGGGGDHPPQNCFSKIFFAINFPEGTTAAARRQGMLEGGVTPPKKISIFFFAKKFPDGATAATGSQMVLKGGRKGGVFPTFKKDGARSATQQSSL